MRQLSLSHKAQAEFWIEAVKANDYDPVNHCPRIRLLPSEPPQERADRPSEEKKDRDQEAGEQEKKRREKRKSSPRPDIGRGLRGHKRQ